MNAQPEAETNIHCPSAMLGSEDSEEETSQKELPITSWNELSIIERVGLNSVEMSEKYLETAFSQIALAFRCDQYTLKQRLQAEEHDRNLAEENIQLELTRGKETLETLKVLCLDSKRSKILQRLELCLDILAGTVERISNTAEVLGAVHQEARVSRAVELMVAHVDNLRRQHAINMAELEEAKKAIQQQSSCSSCIDPRASPDQGDSDGRKKNSHRNSIRRRVSISLISIKTQEKMKDLKKRDTQNGTSSKNSCLSHSFSFDSSCSAMRKQHNHFVDDRLMDPDEAQSEASAAQLHPQSSEIPNLECLLTKPLTTSNTQKKSSTADSLRQRHKGKSVISKRKVEKDKKKKIYKHLSVGTCGSLWRQRFLANQLYRRRRLILSISLFVLFCVITMTYFLLAAL